MPRPSLSVIIPCYRCARYLPTTVNSVAAQHGDFELLEIIIIDDASPDRETRDLLRDLGDRVPIKVISNTYAKGASGARNTGIDAARGDWVAFLDSDDLWTTGSLQHRIEVLHAYPNAVFIGCDFGYLQADGSVDDTGFCRTRPIPRQMLAAAFAHGRSMALDQPLQTFLRAVPTQTSAVMVRRDVLAACGGFDTELRRAEDIHLWLRLATRHAFHFTPHVGTLYRQHAESLTHADEAPATWEILALRKLRDLPEFTPSRRQIDRRLAGYWTQNHWYHRQRGNYRQAFTSAIAALRCQPFDPHQWYLLASAMLAACRT